MSAKTAMVVLLLSFLLAPPAVRAACEVHDTASVPLQVVDGTITVPVDVDGTAATFILDTGAQRSLVTPTAVRRLGLSLDEWVGTTMSGVGGSARRRNADTRSLTLGDMPLVRRTLNHDTSLVVGILPRTRTGNLTIDGLLGRDFLALFDLDLDVTGGHLTLYRVSGCAGRFLPWADDYTSVTVATPTEDALVLPVKLDSVPLRALLDTGASASFLAAPGMLRMGLRPANLSADMVSGVGPGAVMMHRHQFRSLLIGNQVIDSPAVWVASIRVAPIADMVLGADWLAARRVWISYATRQLFVADR